MGMVDQLQELHAFLGGVKDFLSAMKVDVCASDTWTPSNINEKLSMARGYLNLICASELDYKQRVEIARLDVEIVKNDRVDALRNIMYGQEKPIEGKTKEERDSRAEMLLEKAGNSAEVLRKKENLYGAMKAALGMLESAKKNLDGCRRDLVGQLAALKVERGIGLGFDE